MCKCSLCGSVSHNEAEFSVSFGAEDFELWVCRWCQQDLILMGVKFNQIVQLPTAGRPHHIPFVGLLINPTFRNSPREAWWAKNSEPCGQLPVPLPKAAEQGGC